MVGREPVLGRDVNLDHVHAAKENVLDPDEILFGIFTGWASRDGKPFVSTHYMKYYMLITNQRVVFWGRARGIQSVDAFDYRHIQNVGEQQRVLGGDIVFDVKGSEVRMGLHSADAHAAAKLIRETVQLRVLDVGTAPTMSGPPSIPDLIRKLAELKKAGVLTEEEFQSKKTDLLSRM
jgi:hypothetical protein